MMTDIIDTEVPMTVYRIVQLHAPPASTGNALGV